MSAIEVFRILEKDFPSAQTELTYESPFQLLVAVILSAQCTDERVNQVTPTLFDKYPTPPKLACAQLKDVEQAIHSCGFFRMKAKNLIACSQALVKSFGGIVPRTIEELTSLPGVGRKTASVVLNQAFNLPAIAVDTHVKRVSQRLGWAQHTDPKKIEFELREYIPMELWSKVNSMLILHGRRTCKARKPLCELCSIRVYCNYFNKGKSSKHQRR